jgi:RNA polymerase primary sigma factor
MTGSDRSSPPRVTASHRAGTRRLRHDHRALLSAADERWLAQAIEAGRAAQHRLDGCGTHRDGDVELVAEGQRARHHFIEANVRLVQSIANRFSVPAHLDRDDIVQDGMIGLEKAVEKYDWRRGYKFSTYATWWIRQSIQRGLEASANTIRIPGHRTRELRTAIAASTTSGNRLDDDLAMIDMLSQLESMDRSIGDGADTLGTLVAGDDEGPDEAAERRIAREQIDALLEHLDDTSAFAVAARFGLRGREPATFAVIAAELGVTPQAVRRRVERAIVKLRVHAEPIAA